MIPTPPRSTRTDTLFPYTTLFRSDGTPGDMNSLYPEDVECITVLKDAASASIYGARAAEGVILVRTKTGKPGALRIRYQGSVSVLTPTRFPEQAHSYDGAVLANLAAQNAGATPFSSNSSEARRVGNECVGTGRARRSPYN